MENVIIIGSGMAGYTAAIYTARANLTPLLIDGPQAGGQITLTTDVENYPGFPKGILGPELANEMRKQAERFGTKYLTGWVTKISKEKNFTVELSDGKKIESKTVIIASGASARWLEIPSEKAYKGKGVTACATCDGFFFKGMEVVVIGGGDSAMEEANFLTKFATKVTIIHRREEFRASKIMLERARKNEKIEFQTNKVVEEVLGDGKEVQGLKLKDTISGEISEFKTQGVFMAIGHIPNTKFLQGFAELDDHGFLKTDRWTKTNIEGLFGAGDVQDTKYRQAVTAAGSGCQAAIEAEHYIENQN